MILAFITVSFIIKAIIVIAANMAIAYFLNRPSKPDPGSLEDFSFPTCEEGRSWGVLFGKLRLKGPNVVWYGDLLLKRLIDHNDFPAKDVQIGWRYHVGIHMIFCHGPIDGVKQIWYGDKVVWPTVNDLTSEAADGETSAFVDAWEAWGGDEGDGGIQGTVDIEYGDPQSQGQNAYLAQSSLCGADVSAYRWRVGLVFNRVMLSKSTYVRPVSVLAKRTDTHTDGTAMWYAAKANVGDNDDMNPAHMIYECVTDKQWGMGLADIIDETSFRDAADTLYDDGFGLSAYWADQRMVGEFIMAVCRHIDGVVYQDLTTGKFKLVLARDDYTVGDLASYDESDIVSIDDYARESIGEVADQVTITYTDRWLARKASVTESDPAMIARQGGQVIPMTYDYPMICDDTLAGKVAQRELRDHCAMPASMTIRGNRALNGIQPFDVFKINFPPLGITDLIVRAIEIDQGTLEDGTVAIKATQDVYTMGAAISAGRPDTGWTRPGNVPLAATYRQLSEATWYDLNRYYGSSPAASLDADAGYLITAAVKPTDDALSYNLQVRDTAVSDYINIAYYRPWTPTATLVDDLPQNVANVEISLVNCVDLDIVLTDTWARIGNELVKVTAVDATNETVTIARAVLDTVPTSHSYTDRIWFTGTAGGFCYTEYTAGDTPGTRLLTVTRAGTLAEGSAPTDTADAFVSRMNRPYPPANVKINGSSFPASFTGELTVSWSHRDRTAQKTLIVEQTAASVGPEATVTYTLKLYDEGDSLVRTVTGLTGTSYTWSDADERSDCGIGAAPAPLNTQVRFELFAVRGAYDSYQTLDVTIDRVISSPSSSPSATPSPSGSPSASPSGSPSSSPSMSPSSSPSPSSTPSSSPSGTPSSSVSSSPSTSPSSSPSA